MEFNPDHDFFKQAPAFLMPVLKDFDKEYSVIIGSIVFFALVYSVIGAVWFKLVPEPKPIEKFQEKSEYWLYWCD